MSAWPSMPESEHTDIIYEELELELDRPYLLPFTGLRERDLVRRRGWLGERLNRIIKHMSILTCI